MRLVLCWGARAVGVVFDIKQMAVFDGPGIRTTVFLKGCPLRCQWCHNPEGLSPRPELMVSHASCTHCGRCAAVCPSPEQCVLCGKCVRVCPDGLRRICGTEYTPEQLADILLEDRDYLAAMGGGVTFSGGEPTMQARFVTDTARLLKGMHLAVETCGYCAPEDFDAVVSVMDYVMMDLKLVDENAHRAYTGASNKPILANLERLKASGKPFRIRIPVIPGVNDSAENFRATAELVAGAPGLEMVELLPYHKTAGAKYSMVGKRYAPGFDVSAVPNVDTRIFAERGIRCARL